ncbi:DgyrCDS283 [Dimorphilus gyrociliatus]|uniref:Selenoprotein O n=1 Tax=Dimorphilus gyrociliatus TaxID=2664684 RepID=A0A7I8V429_9ANNE|nr:DgyrCDS283 [Dimorphilus gyrociliatus]
MSDNTSSSQINLNFDNRCLRELPIDKEEHNFTRQVSGACFSRVDPTPVDNPTIVAYSKSALELIGLDEEHVQSKIVLDTLSGCKKFNGSETYAHCYCGHQFGNFAGQLGDGAAIYLGEVVHKDKRYEMQLKGAGKTPYSREADGRKVLRSSIREFLASEAMHYLGIPTTRAGTIITSDTKVVRDIFYDGNAKLEKASIVLRISPSFIRFGSFEICKQTDSMTGRKGPSFNKPQTLVTLLDYCVKHYYPEIWEVHSNNKEKMCREFLMEISKRTAELVASWQCIGFCHGVLNTDNMSILGLTIDYGPYGFLDRYDPHFICNASDSGGRYTYERQPEICKWNVGKLCEALTDFIPSSDIQDIMECFDVNYNKSYLSRSREKLGILHATEAQDKQDMELIKEFYNVMEANGSDFTNTWRCLSNLNFPTSENFKESHEITLTSLKEASSTLEELKLAFAPKMETRELQMFVQMAQMNPELLNRIGVGANIVLRELQNREKMAEIKDFSDEEALKVYQQNKWNDWLNQYVKRLEADIEGVNTDIKTLNTERRNIMNKANPKLILRNYIAQSVIEKAERGDFIPANNILKLLETPFEDHLLESNIDRLTLTDNKEESVNRSSVDPPDYSVKDEVAKLGNKPPTWATAIKVT